MKPEILLFPAGIIMMVIGFVSKFKSSLFSFQMSENNGLLLGIFGFLFTLLGIYLSIFHRKKTDSEGLREKVEKEILMRRTALTSKTDSVMQIIERAPNSTISISELVNELEMEGTEIVLRINNLMLQQLVEYTDNKKEVTLSELYRPLYRKNDTTVFTIIKE
jgi:hypothetical protein